MVGPSEVSIPLSNRFSLLAPPAGPSSTAVNTHPAVKSSHISPSSFHIRPPPPSSSQINQLTTHGRRLIKMSGSIGGHPAVILIDSGATGNFISSGYALEHRLPSSSIGPVSLITLADGSQHKSNSIVEFAQIRIGSYTDSLSLVAVPLSGYDAILGMSWLYHFNPEIDWREQRVAFEDDSEKSHVLYGLSPSSHSSSSSRRSSRIDSRRRGREDLNISATSHSSIDSRSTDLDGCLLADTSSSVNSIGDPSYRAAQSLSTLSSSSSS